MDNPKTRLEEWEVFSELVKEHIGKYAKGQYKDKGEDPASAWSYSQCMDQIKKYYKRKDSREREGENKRDLLKIAHYACVSYFKLLEDTEKTENSFYLTEYEREYIKEVVTYLYHGKKVDYYDLEKVIDILNKE